MELKTPQFDPARWGIGKSLGSGLDKETFEAIYIDDQGQPVKTQLVLKHQHGKYDCEHRAGQTKQELAAQDYLLSRIEHDWAKAALGWISQIVGWWADGKDLWILQERVEFMEWGEPGFDIWETPVGSLPDQGGSNCGKHPVHGGTVSCDYGLAKAADMRHLGDTALRYAARAAR